MAVRRIAALALAWCVCAAPGPGASRLPDAAERAFEQVSADDLRGYVETLASDDLRGRGLGEPGNRTAEEYVCAALRRNGVTPAAADGSCYQPVAVYRPAPGVRAALRVTKEDGTRVADLSFGPDFYPLPQSGGADVTARVVF